MDLQEVAAALTGAHRRKPPLGNTLKLDLGEAGSLFIDGGGSGNTVTVNEEDDSCRLPPPSQ